MKHTPREWHRQFYAAQRAKVVICTGCKHDIPGDCAKREVVDGWLKFPEGDCHEPKPTQPQHIEPVSNP